VYVDANIEEEEDVATPTEDWSTRLIQMTSQVIGFTYSKKEFNNELTYMHTMAPRSSNQASSKEGNFQFRMSFPQKKYYNHLVFCSSFSLNIQGLYTKRINKQ
jgi:hypothetical protein